MSAVTFEWAPLNAKSTAGTQEKSAKSTPTQADLREPVAADQAAAGARRAGRAGSWRRLLGAAREIWLFSRTIGKDWRHSSSRPEPSGRHWEAEAWSAGSRVSR
jgi:hypothetical protein